MEVIAYCAPLNEIRADGDWVSYIDSGGFEHYCCAGLNIYWDFENVEEGLAKEIDWEERRYEIAKEVFASIYDIFQNKSLEKLAVHAADALIAELKKGGKNEAK